MSDNQTVQQKKVIEGADELADVIVIGSGPAGYTAALYLARAKKHVKLFSGHEIGGQLMFTTVVENYPGFAEGIRGPQLMMAMRQQAERFGAQIIDKLVASVGQENDGRGRFWIQTNTGEKQFAKAILIATGAKSRMLGLPDEDKFLGRGLSTCAVCDAAFYKDKKVVVVGGGDSAVEDALALARFTDQVTLVHRRDSLRASKIMQERLLSNPNIKVRWNAAPIKLETGSQNGLENSENKTSAVGLGMTDQLSAVVIKNTVTGQEERLEIDGIFYAIGHVPATEFLGDLVQLDKQGYVVTRLGLTQPSVAAALNHINENGLLAYPTMTSVEGIFAAGDNVDCLYRQAVTAAGFGTMAALDAERWLERQAE